VNVSYAERSYACSQLWRRYTIGTHKGTRLYCPFPYGIGLREVGKMFISGDTTSRFSRIARLSDSPCSLSTRYTRSPIFFCPDYLKIKISTIYIYRPKLLSLFQDAKRNRQYLWQGAGGLGIHHFYVRTWFHGRRSISNSTIYPYFMVWGLARILQTINFKMAVQLCCFICIYRHCVSSLKRQQVILGSGVRIARTLRKTTKIYRLH
jgi:hypothetical protein